MEILLGYITSVKFTVPSGVTLATFKVFNGTTQIGATANATIAGTLATCTLPYAAVAQEQDLRVELSFSFQSSSYTKNQYVSVVTPYLEVHEVQEVWPAATEAEAIEIESAVRHIINAHCGQTFGFIQNVSKTIEGHGEQALRLPTRLVTLTGLATLTATLDINSVIIVSDGWYLKKGWAEELTQIDSDSTYWSPMDGSNGIFVEELPGRGPVIKPPTVEPLATKWKDDYPFKVTGNWGYLTVPSAVVEAAKLLVNDYACSEQLYRDRYLESIKASDWRLQFSANAWVSTGNVRADQLLSEFVLWDWAVI